MFSRWAQDIQEKKDLKVEIMKIKEEIKAAEQKSKRAKVMKRPGTNKKIPKKQ